MAYFSRHAGGRSAVESVTTRKPVFAKLLDAEDERVVLLAPVLDLHLEAWKVAADGLGEELQVLCLGALALVDGDQLVLVGLDVLQGQADDRPIIGATVLQLVVDERDDVALLDRD